MNKCIFLIFLIFSTEFAFANNEIITKRTYPNISKNAIFDAAKKLFFISNKENDNSDFIINAYRDKLEVEKVVFQNSIIMVDLLLDKWIMEVYEFENESRVNLILQRSDAVNLEDKYEVDISFHNLFWDRLEYLLGVNTTWNSCESYFSTTLNSYYCYNYLLTNKPEGNMISNNILISQKNKNLNTIDNIKADIFDKTDLSLEKNSNNIFDNNEDILNSSLLTPIMQDSILETKAEKVIKKETVKNKDIPLEEVKDEIQNSDQSIDEFKDNMKDIVNMKNSLNDKDIQKIITESNDLKENSEFSLDSN